MGRDFRHALADIFAAIVGIERATSRKSLDDFTADWLLRHGGQRGIEIISEASRAIPPEVQSRRPEIPWAKIRGIGNVLRHAYQGVSDELIWRVVADELLPLRAAIEDLLKQSP